MKAKSNEPTKTNEAMKKTFRFLSMAALAVVGAVMTGCSSDELADNQPVKKGRVVTQTVTISLDEAAATRALTDHGVKTFASGECIAVFYMDTEGLSHKAYDIPLGNISADGKSASFTVTMTDPAPGGAVRYVYPSDMSGDVDTDLDVNSDDDTIDWNFLYTLQYGTLDDLADYFDLATFDGTLSAEGKLPSGALVNRLAVLAIKIKDESSNTNITEDIENLTITAGTNTYDVDVDDGGAGQSTIYVAIRPTNEQDISVSATTTADENFVKALSGKTYEAGNWYSVTWNMDSN